ncbi:MAG: replicative DNA helicase [Bacteroidota bacterium]
MENPEIETAILGALLLEKEAILRLEPALPVEAFTSPARQETYAAILELFQRGDPIDLLSVKACLKRKGRFQKVGNLALTEYLGAVASSANLSYHAQLLLEAYLGRQLSEMGLRLRSKAQDPTEDVFDLIESISSDLLQLEYGLKAGQSPRWDRLLVQAVETAEERVKAREAGESVGRGILSGLPSLDGVLQGLQAGELVLLAARPGMGKSSLMRQLMLEALRQSVPVLLFSLEMSAQQVTEGLLANAAGIPARSLRLGQLDPGELDRYQGVAGELYRADLTIDDSGGLNVMALRARTTRWRLKRKEAPIGLLCVDYLQLLQGSQRFRKSSQRHLELGEISRALKELALNHRLAVLALSQLNREVDKRPDPRPMLSDLRQSGNLEQDADKVLFLYRPAYYATMQGREARDAEGNDLSDLALVLLAKHRTGATGEVALKWEAERMGFGDG